MAIWAYLRHYINLRILYALSPISIPGLPFPANEFATVGSYTLNWETQQYKCWISQIITFALLAALQAVNAFWFFLIVRILWRLVFAGVQKDDRSDDEDEDEEIEDVKAHEKAEVVAEKEQQVLRNGTAKGPSVMINGEPIAEVAEASGNDNRRRSMRRKQ